MNHGNSGFAHGTSGSPQITIENNELKLKSKEQESKIKSNIVSNVENMKPMYQLNQNGYFGVKGKNCRIILSEDPVNTSIDFNQKIGANGEKYILPNGKGTKIILDDGTIIVHRIITSTKGSPAVEISLSASQKVKNQKIHFVKEN